MGQAALYGWDPVNEEWIMVQVNSDGELLLTTD